MVLTLPSAAAKALPITLREFSESLSSTWHHHAQRMPRPITMGLAISGGVDSMALASLCARVQSSGSSDWRFRAFVVDHGARVGSNEEAQAVAELVNKKGIHTKVLKIEWPEDFIPSESSKFESLARGFRFRLLGEACSDFNVQNLLLAHHEDDQFETILMRLSAGHRGPGLLGMKPNSQIPECYGIYGVYNSGAKYSGMVKEQEKSISFEDSKKKLSFHGQNERTEDDFQINSNSKAKNQAAKAQKKLARLSLEPMQIEDGGIRILRPLLQYSKERLIATCLEDDTSWFEDHTNADPTLTPRNAIRHIYNRHTLPAALQKEAIIALSASLQDKKDSLARQALSLFDRCATRAFEPRGGSLFIRFPKLIHPESNPATGRDESAELQTGRELADRLLKYAIEAVSPYETRQYPLVSACHTVFPELAPNKDQGEKDPVRFTVAGVSFERRELEISSPIKDVEVASEAKSLEVKPLEVESPEVDSSEPELLELASSPIEDAKAASELESPEHESPEPEVESSTELVSPVLKPPLLESPELESPELELSELESSEVKSSELESSKLKSSDLESLELESSEPGSLGLEFSKFGSSEAISSEVESSEAGSSEVELSEVESSEVESSEIESSDAKSSQAASSAVESPELESSEAKSLEPESSEARPDQAPQHQKDAIPMQEHEWFLTRQPHESALARNHVLEYPPRDSPFQDAKDGWRLYDGRFWIRIANHGAATIRVRPFRKADLHAFHRVHGDAKFKLRSRLRRFAHGEVRFTLPVIVAVAAGDGDGPATGTGTGSVGGGGGGERVLALPTLDVAVGGADKVMEYGIRYKKVDWLCVPGDGGHVLDAAGALEVPEMRDGLGDGAHVVDAAALDEVPEARDGPGDGDHVLGAGAADEVRDGSV